MAQPAAADRPRAGPRLAPLARLAGPRQDHPQRNRVPYPDRPAAARIPPNPPRGSPPDSAAALNWTQGRLARMNCAVLSRSRFSRANSSESGATTAEGTVCASCPLISKAVVAASQGLRGLGWRRCRAAQRRPDGHQCQRRDHGHSHPAQKCQLQPALPPDAQPLRTACIIERCSPAGASGFRRALLQRAVHRRHLILKASELLRACLCSAAAQLTASLPASSAAEILNFVNHDFITVLSSHRRVPN